MNDLRSSIRMRLDQAGEHLRKGDTPGALDILLPGVKPEQVEERARPNVECLTGRVREIQKRLIGSAPIDPSGARGLAQMMSVYVRALGEMKHSPEDATIIANLLTDLQVGNLSRRLPTEIRDRLLAALIHAVVELSPEA